MKAQAYEDYVEGGQFYPREPIHSTGRYQAILTVLDVPTQDDNTPLTRMEWLNHLEAAYLSARDEYNLV